METRRSKETRREVEETRLLTREEQESFGVAPQPHGPHPLAVRPRWRHHGFVTAVAAGFFLLTALFGLAFGNGDGTPLAGTGRIPVSDLPVELEFETAPSIRLVKLQLYTDVSNGWAWFDMELEDEAGEAVLSGGREISYYSGRDSDGRWTEGSQRGSVVFPVDSPERYTLSVEMSEYGSGQASDQLTSSVVDIRVGGLRFSWRPLAGTAGVFLLIFLATQAAEFLRRGQIMAGSDWTEED